MVGVFDGTRQLSSWWTESREIGKHKRQDEAFQDMAPGISFSYAHLSVLTHEVSIFLSQSSFNSTTIWGQGL